MLASGEYRRQSRGPPSQRTTRALGTRALKRSRDGFRTRMARSAAGQICLTNRRFWKRTAADSLLGSLTPRPRSAPEEAAKSRCKRRARSAGRPSDPTGDYPSVVHEVLGSILAQGRPRSPRFSGQGLLAAARPRKGSHPKSKTREGARSEGRHPGQRSSAGLVGL